ncbi:MAG: type II toxin-antitoxin system VapC family toxin [Phycisphaeraceae bacterium]
MTSGVIQSVQPIRVYADTSVYGGIFDAEFGVASRAFFEMVRNGRFRLVLSAVVRMEIEQAPPHVRDFVRECESLAELADTSEEALRLRSAYLRAGIVGAKWNADALHVAVATVSDCRVIVSWNFKHIVHFQKIPLYNGINQGMGYAPIAIHSPAEVITNDNQD